MSDLADLEQRAMTELAACADEPALRAWNTKYFGPNGTAVNYSAGTSSTNLQSDLYWRYVQATGVARRSVVSRISSIATPMPAATSSTVGPQYRVGRPGAR